MTQNQGETYFHDLGHGGSCTAFYRGCFGNLFLGTRTPMFDGLDLLLKIPMVGVDEIPALR